MDDDSLKSHSLLKRKKAEKKAKRREEESSSDEDDNILDVDFEFFDPQPEHDFHGLKTLLRQLLDADAQLIDLSALADLILAQPLLGSTVKVDGNESDPYAFLTVINLKQHKNTPVMKHLIEYLKVRCKGVSALSDVPELLDPDRSDAEIGLILTDRLLNMPAELVPPMFRMLLEEMTWALEEKEPYKFTHYLILSKTYTEVQSQLDSESVRPKKKKKALESEEKSAFHYFHPEDKVFHKHALAFGNFRYLKEGEDSDSKRAFQELGIKPTANLTLIKAEKLETAVGAVEEYLKPS